MILEQIHRGRVCVCVHKCECVCIIENVSCPSSKRLGLPNPVAGYMIPIRHTPVSGYSPLLGSLFSWRSIIHGVQTLKALFECCRIHLNPHMLEWIEVEFSSKVPLQSTPTYVDWCESDHIQTRPKGLIWCVGDGTQINIWLDPWIPNGVRRTL